MVGFGWAVASHEHGKEYVVGCLVGGRFVLISQGKDILGLFGWRYRLTFIKQGNGLLGWVWLGYRLA